MAPRYDLNIKTRDTSPAASDTSDVTELSRSPSPVSDNEAIFSQPSTPTSTVSPSPHRLREANGRFSPRKQILMSSSVSRSPTNVLFTTPPPIRRTRQTRPMGGAPPPTPLRHWVAGEGGFGTLDVLPREVRQMIFGRAFGSLRGNPVSVRQCCGPDTTERIRDGCRRHGLLAKRDAGRFNILQVSKAMRAEASWIVYHKTSLLLDMNEAMAPYMPDFQPSMSLRRFGPSILASGRKAAFWKSAAQFRHVHLRVPESTVQWGVPVDFTANLLQTTITLYKLWEQLPALSPGTVRFVRVHLSSLFQEMLPFNMESQAASRYGELLDWLCRHSPTAEPDFDREASDCTHNLRRMLEIAGINRGKYKWDVLVHTKVDAKDEGGIDALRSFLGHCAENGIHVMHQ